MKQKKKNQQRAKRIKYPRSWAVCNDYLTPCPTAQKCDNCKNRGFRIRDGVSQVYCKAHGDADGDHFECFVCNMGAKCRGKE
jgi:hypothetical protein